MNVFHSVIMENFMNVISSMSANLPLRPLLYVSGAAVGIYYYIKRKNVQAKESINSDQSVSRETESRDRTESLYFFLETVEETEEKYRQAMEDKAQLEKEKVDLMCAVCELKCSLQDMQTHMNEAMLTLADSKRRCELTYEVNGQLLQNNVFLSDEVSRLEETILQLELELLNKSNEMMRVLDKEPPLDYEDVMGRIKSLEEERFCLTSDLHSLKNSNQQLEEMLSYSEQECETLNQKCETLNQEKEELQQSHRLLKMQNSRMKQRLIQCSQALKRYGADPGPEKDLD